MLVLFALLALLLPRPVQPAGESLTDAEILLDIAAACNVTSTGDRWPAELNWTTASVADNTFCRDWLGVSCDSTGRHVTHISLPAVTNATLGTEAPAIVCNASRLAGVAWDDLTYLSVLSLRYQQFYGELAPDVLEPPNLQCVVVAWQRERAALLLL